MCFYVYLEVNSHIRTIVMNESVVVLLVLFCSSGMVDQLSHVIPGPHTSPGIRNSGEQVFGSLSVHRPRPKTQRRIAA